MSGRDALERIGTSPAPIRNLPPAEPSLPLGGKVLRTEKVGSGHYTNITTKPLKTGYPHLDAYGEARKSVAFASVDGYCRQLRNTRKKLLPNSGTGVSTAAYAQNTDSAARDAVRCIEHTMVVVSGEKSVYRCVISPPASTDVADQERDGEGERPSVDVHVPQYQRALVRKVLQEKTAKWKENILMYIQIKLNMLSTFLSTHKATYFFE